MLNRAWVVPWHWVAVGVIIAIRTATLGLSAWPVHQGYVEVFYVNVARGATPVPEGLEVLPMRYVPLEWSFLVFGESEWAARFPGMIALSISAIAAGGIGGALVGEYGRKWSPVFLVTNPWVLSWYGRAMPDAWLCTSLLVTGFLVLRANQKPWVFGTLIGPAMLLGVASKPAGFLAMALLIMLRRRDAFLIALGSIAATFILAGHVATGGHPELLLSRLAHIAALRFGSLDTLDLPGMILTGIVLGCAGVAWLAWCRPFADATLPLYAFLGQTLWYAIPNHEYYALPVATWGSVAATPFMESRPRLMAIMVLVSTIMTPFALFDTGALGDNRTRIVEAFPPGVTVSIVDHLHLGPMFEYYRPDLHLVGVGQAANYTVSIMADVDGCVRVGARNYGPLWIYAQDCRVV